MLDSSVAKSVRLFCGNMRTVYWTMRLKNFSALASGRALITYEPSCAQGPKNSEHNLVARGQAHAHPLRSGPGTLVAVARHTAPGVSIVGGSYPETCAEGTNDAASFQNETHIFWACRPAAHRVRWAINTFTASQMKGARSWAHVRKRRLHISSSGGGACAGGETVAKLATCYKKASSSRLVGVQRIVR